MASGIGSLGSATNSNIQTGPALNNVGRSNIKVTASLVTNDDQIKDGAMDIKRHELCLTTDDKAVNAYVPVISTDLIFDKKICIEADKDFYRLPCDGTAMKKSVLDMTIATYYQDVGDARNDFELMLARTQISLHSYKSLVQRALMHSQDRLFWARQDPGFTQKHRRNAVFLVDAVDLGESEVEHGGKWTPFEVVANSGDGAELANVFFKFKYTLQVIMAENNSNIWAINVENLKEQDLKLALEVLAHYIETTDNIKTFTPKSSNCSPIKPPNFRYAGIALTDACMHPQNGDTAVTINIFSALTIDNGPFHVVTNDELMWMHEIELPDFMSDGLRRRRVVLDSRSLYEILQPGVNNSQQNSAAMAFQKITQLAESEPIVRQQNGVPGNPNRKTFLIAPCKRGFSLLQRTSIVDHERRMGRSIGGAKPGKRLDLINGACAHF